MFFDAIQPWWPVLACFAAALFAPLLSGAGGKVPAALWALVPAAGFVLYASGLSAMNAGEVWRGSIAWAPDLGVNWDAWISPVGLLLALLVSGIGTLIFLYASAYLHGADRIGRFLCFLFLFAGAMLGLAVTENLLVFFVFWELTSISSYLLIGHFHEKEESRKSALDALLVTAGGGVAFLVGVLLLGEIGGTYVLGELIEQREAIQAHSLYPAVFFCVLAGAVTKSAQFPFHFWLPGAMAAPAPVSAYLHSATMVKAGVFLLAILHPLLGGTPLWHGCLMAFGAVTMTWGGLVAMVQTDLKRLLAFSTVSALGTLVLLLGIEGPIALKTAVVFLIVHALYKGALFMVAGSIEKATGTREIPELGGLMRSFPLLGIGAAVAAFSMCGLPPFVGFIAKELLYEAKLGLGAPLGYALVACGILANAANVVVAVKVGLLPFFGREQAGLVKNLKPRKFGFWAGPLVLAAGSIAFGLAAGPLLDAPVSAMAGQIDGAPAEVSLHLWHGFNLVLVLSLVTVALGVALFLLRRRLWALRERFLDDSPFNATTQFRNGLKGFLIGANWVTRTIQSGNLTAYVLTIFLVAMAALASAWWLGGYRLGFEKHGTFRLEVLVIALAVIVLSVLLVGSSRRMTSIFLLGGIGFAIAAIFALYGAPDLAITQILVETLTLMLFSLAIYHLPGMRKPEPSFRAHAGSVTVALLVGVAFTSLTLMAFDVQLTRAVGNDLARLSLPEGYGRNVVNVILVDFRALDTMGEVTVLFIAALGVFAMLGKERNASRNGPVTPVQGGSHVLAASAKITAPAMLVFSLYLLLRGHNEPGGGFIGGLVAAMAAALVHLARPEHHLRLYGLRPGHLMIAGLTMLVLSGIPGMLGGGPYLLSVWWGEFTLPAVGKMKLGTPLIFDVGVYLVVAGVVLVLYRTLSEARLSRALPQPTTPDDPNAWK